MELIECFDNPHNEGADGPTASKWWEGAAEEVVDLELEKMGDVEAGEAPTKIGELAHALKAKYEVTRSKAAHGTTEEKAPAREKKRGELVEEAIDLVKAAPGEGDDAEAKRDFSLKLARIVARMDVSPQYKKVSQDFARLRERQGADREKKKEIRAKREAVAGAVAEAARKEEEEREERMALQRAPPSPKKKRGRKKADLMEEEKADRRKRRKQQMRESYARRKSKASKQTDGGQEQRQLVAVESGAPADPFGSVCGQIAPIADEDERFPGQWADSETESSVDF